MAFSDNDFSMNGETLNGNYVHTFDTEYIPPKSKNLFSISIEKYILDYVGIVEEKEFDYTLHGSVYRGGGSWDHLKENRVTIDLTKLRKIN